jgi:O-antigen/teichoic acid export membrane protein
MLRKSTAASSMASGGMLSVVRLATGVVRVKLVALALGASGVGVYALLLQLYVTGVAAVSMSLAVPIINIGRPKVVAGDMDEAGRVAGTALTVVATNAVLLILLAILFGPALFAQLGIATEASGLLVPIALAIVIGAFSTAFWEGLSYLSDRFDIYVGVGMIGAVAEMLFIGGAAWVFGLKGAAIAMPVASAAMFLAYAWLLRRDPTARKLLSALAVKARLLPQILTYSVMMFASAALANIAMTFLRSRVLVEAGAAANGYLQTVTSMSGYMLAFVMTGFWGHLHPLAAAHGDTPAVRKELGHSLELGLLIAFTGCGVAAVTAPYIIPLFFSREFLAGSYLMIAYMPGELCFQVLTMLTAYQLTVSKRRVYLALSLGYIALLVACGLLLIPMFGPLGYVLAHVGASLLMAVFALTVAWRLGQVGGRQFAEFMAALLFLALACFALLPDEEPGISPTFALIAVLPFAVTGLTVLGRMRRDFFNRKKAEA